MKQQVISSRAVPTIGSQHRLNLAEARHRELDSRLKELGRHAHLTPAEQLEMTHLKKLKLAAKDEIADLRRRMA